MLSFFEYIAQSRKVTLPDTHTMLSMAGVSLDVPNEEETKRLLNRDKKRHPLAGKGVTKTIHRQIGQAVQPAAEHH
jgi:hypothetical protein